MNKSVGDFWSKHKTLAQIIAILAMLASLYGTHYEASSNTQSIQGQNTWMKEAIKEQSQEIKALQISNAALKQEVEDLKENKISAPIVYLIK